MNNHIFQLLFIAANYIMHFYTAISTLYTNCTDGELRLVGGADASEGRVEVCINNAWGSICSQLFDDIDAGVVCQELGGFYREG